MKFKSILFVYYPRYVRFNHAVALLTAILKWNGIDADYAPCDETFEDRIGRFDAVGFSFVTAMDHDKCLPYMKAAKDRGKMVLAGGVYPRHKGSFVEPNLVDYVCRGEAEIISDFFVNGDTRVFDEPYYQPELDSLPMPDLCHLTGYEFGFGLKSRKGLKIIPYFSSRGCPNVCTFCEVRHQTPGVRIRHSIHEDITALYKEYHPDLIAVCDEMPPYYLQEWREQWKDLYVPFGCEIRGDIKPEHLEFLIEHGLKAAAFGVESGNEVFRNKVLKKGVTNEDVFRTVGILKKHGVKWMAFFMIGIPGENYSDKRATALMAFQLLQMGGNPSFWEYRENLKRGWDRDYQIKGLKAQ